MCKDLASSIMDLQTIRRVANRFKSDSPSPLERRGNILSNREISARIILQSKMFLAERLVNRGTFAQENKGRINNV